MESGTNFGTKFLGGGRISLSAPSSGFIERLNLMPRISSFYGIVIWMYFDEPQHEGRPHFHATYGDDEASFDIDSLELIAGGLPRRARKLVTEWAKEHQKELLDNWSLARDHQPPHPIEPLG